MKKFLMTAVLALSMAFPVAAASDDIGMLLYDASQKVVANLYCKDGLFDVKAAVTAYMDKSGRSLEDAAQDVSKVAMALKQKIDETNSLEKFCQTATAASDKAARDNSI